MSRDAKIGLAILIAAAAVAVFIWLKSPKETSEGNEGTSAESTASSESGTGGGIAKNEEPNSTASGSASAPAGTAEQTPSGTGGGEPPATTEEATAPAGGAAESATAGAGTGTTGSTPGAVATKPKEKTEPGSLGGIPETSETATGGPHGGVAQDTTGAASPQPGTATESAGTTEPAQAEKAASKPTTGGKTPKKAKQTKTASERGPAKAKETVEVSEKKPAVEGGSIYIVKKGDTLQKIAREQLGAANRYQEIYEANKDVIGPNPAHIMPGMKLVIPKAPQKTSDKPEKLAATRTSGTPALAAAEPAGLRYTARRGDTFEGIAAKFYRDRDKWTALYQANKERLQLSRPDRLEPGMVVLIPDLK